MGVKSTLLVFMALFCQLASAQELTVHSITHSRQLDPTSQYTLDGWLMTNSSRQKLLNPKNFGKEGMYLKTVNILDRYEQLGSLVEVSDAPTDHVLFFGGFDEYESRETFSQAEIEALYQWSLRGGKVIIATGGSAESDEFSYDQDILDKRWDFKYQLKFPSQVLPTEEGRGTVLFNGPFGQIVGAVQAGFMQGYFSQIPENSKVLGTDVEGNPTLYLDCTTLDLVAADVDIYTELSGVSSGDAIVTSQDIHWANTIVFMDQMQAPPVITSQDAILLLNDQYNAYQWYKDGEAFSVDSMLVDFSPGSYTVDVTMNGGCVVTSDPFRVLCLPLPVVDLGPDTLMCHGEALALDVFVDGSSYVWQDKTTESSFTVTSSGLYWVEVSNQCGTSTDAIQVEFTEGVDLGEDQILCQGSKVLLDAELPEATYLWQDGSSISKMEVTESGLYWVEVTDSCGVQRDSVRIVFDPEIELEIKEDTTLCAGDTLLLDATVPNATYRWQDDSVTPTYEVTEEGSYSVSVRNACGTKLATIRVKYINLDLGGDIEICEGQQATIDATVQDAVEYFWQDGFTEPLYTVTDPGLYAVEVIHPQCGSYMDSVYVVHKPNPDFTLGPNASLCPGETYLLDATTAGATYLWQDGATEPVYLATGQGSYSVTVTVDGCSTSDGIVLEYECAGTLVLPNVFTPNNDGVNDQFLPIESTYIESMYTSIFDRTGRVLYESDGFPIVWDGRTESGSLVNAGTYFYFITYVDLAGRRSTVNGIVTVLY